MDVIVYNFGRGEITNRVSVRHAIEMICRGVAKAIEIVENEFYGPFPLPLALELTKYRFPHWLYQKEPKFSRKNVLKRDNYVCAYCEGEADTFDHIHPQSQGGQSEWLNGVAACFSCNQKKRNRTPKQAGMELKYQPYRPLLVDIT
jgi:hypothetical protein